ncbi:MAG: DUF3667 domain-containing protein [Saprospiraceae bacterium]|nr:DUF3667 domain-containing protein [Saprospiraceae bacterium]
MDQSIKSFSLQQVPMTGRQTQQLTTCRSCGFNDDGQFCSNCGGQLHRQRISVSALLESIVDFFSNFETKYVSTFKALLINPVDFLDRYIKGARDSYYIPFKYFFLNLSINFFVYTRFNLATITEEPMEVEVDQLLQLKSDVMFDQIINNYGSFFALLIIPMYVFFARLLFPLVKYNIAEVATAITFLLGQLMLLEVILNLVTVAIPDFYATSKCVVMCAELAIFFVLSYKFFKDKLFHAVWKSLLILIGIYFSMQFVLVVTQNILHFIYE